MSLVNKGGVFENRLLSGVDALVELPMIQAKLDARAGLSTEGFISGYRGSPLGGYDSALWKRQSELAEARIRFQAGVNEDLAATAVWGTQQIKSFPDAKVDGVFGLWYGKGPGVDRCGDVFKHANHAGVSEFGGVLVVAGDDHPGKSSTVAHQSEFALMASSIPILYPADVSEFIEYGLLGWALSRYSGLWVGFKTVNETVEQKCTVDFDLDSFCFQLPQNENFAQSTHFIPGRFAPQEEEKIVERLRIPLVKKFVRENKLNKRKFGDNQAVLGIVTTGKSYGDVLEALRILGIDNDKAKKIGLSVFKVGCVWPLEEEGVKNFTNSLEEVLVIEEKKPLLEPQLKEIFFNEQRTFRIVGKNDSDGEVLLPSDVQLEPQELAGLITRRLSKLGRAAGLSVELDRLESSFKPLSEKKLKQFNRSPYFCSGCPHNRSTQLPEGALGGSGIGCHGMAMFNREDMLNFTQMGGEGAQWSGLAHYVETPHIFQNIGDGTYFHSGLLAIRSAVASNINITYKILFNSAVAMTGGQPVDGELDVKSLVVQLHAEGVKEIHVVAEDPDKYGRDIKLPPFVKIYPRQDLARVQRRLQAVKGCTVIVYDQVCATEKRRMRKRGIIATPRKRLFINPLVCEGCSDCSVKSSCMSIQPLSSQMGNKRVIDQSSCNMDYSCVEGFCPSFVSVYDAAIKKSPSSSKGFPLDIPDPTFRAYEDGIFQLMLSGIGGNGVVTVGAILSNAAKEDGKASSTYDMTGLAQKGGSVYCHLKIFDNKQLMTAQKIGGSQADVVLAFDLLSSVGSDSLKSISTEKSSLFANGDISASSKFVKNGDLEFNSSKLVDLLREELSEGRVHVAHMTSLAKENFGDPLAANFLLVGFLFQSGLLPLTETGIKSSIKNSGVSVDMNLNAFDLGRYLYLTKCNSKDPVRSQNIENRNPAFLTGPEKIDLDEFIIFAKKFLSEYQSQKYVSRFLESIETFKNNLPSSYIGDQRLILAMSRSLFKLMSYKDEYEVARLYSHPEFMSALNNTFEGNYKVKFNLAPPFRLFNRKRKSEYGRWMLVGFKVLSRLKFIRGTMFDVFSYTEERKIERQLIVDYLEMSNFMIRNLSEGNYDSCVEMLELPMTIRGFGDIKKASIERYYEQLALIKESYLSLSGKVKVVNL